MEVPTLRQINSNAVFGIVPSVSGARKPYIKAVIGSFSSTTNKLLYYYKLGLNKGTRLTWAERELNPAYKWVHRRII
jgi:hypothetical protein